MNDLNVFQAAGLAVVGLLIVLAIATLLGVPGAALAAIAVIMLGAAVLGVQTLVEEPTPVEIVAGILLMASGIAGAAVAATGGNPFDRLEVIVPMGIGLAITFLSDED